MCSCCILLRVWVWGYLWSSNSYIVTVAWKVLMWFDSEAVVRVSGAAETVDYFG